jgi:membrane protein DedA with SNARE-associated domain
LDFSLDTVRAWLSQHGVLVFALFAFVDTFALTGLFVPASLVIVAAGFLCAEGTAGAIPPAFSAPRGWPPPCPRFCGCTSPRSAATS